MKVIFLDFDGVLNSKKYINTCKEYGVNSDYIQKVEGKSRNIKTVFNFMLLRKKKIYRKVRRLLVTLLLSLQFWNIVKIKN